jgi:FKBP-type peptidyl-prolyl cis-trans isomerase
VKIASRTGQLAAIGLLAFIPLAPAQDPAPAPTPAPAPSEHPSISIPADGSTPVTSSTGLITSVLKPGNGSGQRPKHGDLVDVRYSGFLVDGTLFDSSGDEVASFRVGQVVPGWNEALATMEPGQRNKITLPPDLAYGDKGAGGQIPPGATLIFDVELVSFEQGPILPAFRTLPEDAQRLESGVRYLVEAPGSGAPAADDAPYKLAYTFFNIGGTPIDSSTWGNGPLLADKQRVMFPFLKELHAELKLGARLWVEVPQAAGFGDVDLPSVKPGEPTIWAIEVLAVLPKPVLPEFRAVDQTKCADAGEGLRYEVVEPGTGDPCGADGIFKLHYTIFAPTGEVIDASRKQGGACLVGTTDMMRLPLLQTLPPLMPAGAIYLAEMPAKEIFGSRLPPGLTPESPCTWRLEMAAVLAPLPVPEFARTAEGAGTQTKSGLLVEWIKKGDGPTLRKDQRAVVHYAGWLEDGTLFDNSFKRGEPSTFAVDQVVPGWTEGLQLMNKGSIARLTLPYQLAYGEQGQGAIPPRANLIFYVELVDIQE